MASAQTFGCQMNARDSEKIKGILETVGYEITESEKADFIVYNTCTVRENANLKVYGHLGLMGHEKKNNPDMMIALCGCMMQEPQVVEKIKKSYRFVNLVFGTHNLYKFAELVYTSMISDRMIIDVWKDTDKIVEDLPSDRKYFFKSGVNIMFGCNNFCSYCIVPYVRGRERSRDPKAIVREIQKMVADGVVEVMLLGQNVNSYGKTLEQPMTFAQLLKEIEQIEGLERIRFMTSHPKDLSDELIQVMGESKKICKHLHLPVQSGSSRILKKMNRRYTKEQYLDLVERIRAAVPDISLTTDIIVGFPGETEEDFKETLDVVREVGFDLQSGSSRILKIMNRKYTKEHYLELVEKLRKAMPDISLTTDIIVGFPGETEEDFQETLDVVRKVRYDSAFTFIYSKRTGTPAAVMENQVPEDVVKDRFDRLLKEVQEIAKETSSRYAGQVVEVLAEEKNHQEEGYLTGRLSNNLLVHFKGDESLIGKLVSVHLTESRGFLWGELVQDHFFF